LRIIGLSHTLHLVLITTGKISTREKLKIKVKRIGHQGHRIWTH